MSLTEAIIIFGGIAFFILTVYAIYALVKNVRRHELKNSLDKDIKILKDEFALDDDFEEQ